VATAHYVHIDTVPSTITRPPAVAAAAAAVARATSRVDAADAFQQLGDLKKLGELRWLTENAHFGISSLSIDIHAERRITLQMLRIVYAYGLGVWLLLLGLEVGLS